MATAEVAPISSARLLEPGISEVEGRRDPVLPSSEEGNPLIPSNVIVEYVTTDQLPEARPSRIRFAAVRDPGLRIVNAIPLDVTVEESTVVACWAEINEFGTGETLSVALDDFASGLRELYQRLFAPDASLGADLLKVKEIIARYVQPRQ